VACDSQFFASVAECPAGEAAKYPRRTKVELIALPAQRTMEDPCVGVPRNGWCPTNKVKQAPYPVPGSPVE
jgi:hypothetical protein